jgi:signal transduction histidine kinase
VSASVNDTASRLGALVERERAFSAETSHQLRTPLAGLRWQLEAALDTPGDDLSRAIRESLTSVDRLQSTIEEPLTLAGNTPRRAVEPLDIAVLVEDLAQRWPGIAAGQGRPLRIELAEPAPIGARSGAGAGQILAVLLDNAAQHGREAVTVAFPDAPPEAMAIDVIDEGVALVDDATELFQLRAPAPTILPAIPAPIPAAISPSTAMRTAIWPAMASASPSPAGSRNRRAAGCS